MEYPRGTLKIDENLNPAITVHVIDNDFANFGFLKRTLCVNCGWHSEWKG
jgi:hypothetical protein